MADEDFVDNDEPIFVGLRPGDATECALTC